MLDEKLTYEDIYRGMSKLINGEKIMITTAEREVSRNREIEDYKRKIKELEEKIEAYKQYEEEESDRLLSLIEFKSREPKSVEVIWQEIKMEITGIEREFSFELVKEYIDKYC